MVSSGFPAVSAISVAPISVAPVSSFTGSGVSLPSAGEADRLLAEASAPRPTGISLPFGLQTPQQAGLLGNNAAPAAASAQLMQVNTEAEAMSGLQEGEANTASPQPSELQRLQQDMTSMTNVAAIAGNVPILSALQMNKIMNKPGHQYFLLSVSAPEGSDTRRPCDCV